MTSNCRRAPYYGQERVGDHSDLPHGGEQRLAQEALLPEHVQLVGLPGVGGHAGVREFLLEGGEQPNPGLARETLERPAQYMARAETPRRPVRRLDIAHEEILGRAVVERDEHPRFGIRNEEDFPHGAERRRLNRSERRYENVRRGEPDAALQPGGEVGGRKALAAKMSRQVAGSDEDDLFPLHPPPLLGVPRGALAAREDYHLPQEHFGRHAAVKALIDRNIQ